MPDESGRNATEALPLPLAGTKCGGYKPAVWSRSVAQPGSAPRSGRGGRRFKSCHSDQKNKVLAHPDFGARTHIRLIERDGVLLGETCQESCPSSSARRADMPFQDADDLGFGLIEPNLKRRLHTGRSWHVFLPSVAYGNEVRPPYSGTGPASEPYRRKRGPSCADMQNLRRRFSRILSQGIFQQGHRVDSCGPSARLTNTPLHQPPPANSQRTTAANNGRSKQRHR